ncbi:MAG TPA: acyl-CoA dehydrogenase [Actinobacteria bacterium]|jgi:alkylation response protein AidB-like acyl-CoA dehydrogenase|nr:acyl-CoA dehydrogenase [Actinomycetota bacterium]
MEGPAPVSQTTTQAEPGRAARPDQAAGHPAGVPDLLYGETETQLRSAVRDLLSDRAAWPDVLARTETADSCDAGLWHTLAADVGCAGLLVPEEHGGAGASVREAAVVAEELGRAVAPVPFLGSAVVATTALLIAGDGELLGGVAAGTVTAALAVPFAAGPGSRPAPTVRLVAPQDGDPAGTARLTGSVRGLADALPADVLLIPADGVPYGLYAVQAGQAGLIRTPVTSLDATRQLCDLTLDNVPARQIAAGGTAERAVAAALAAGAGVLASEQLGIAERCLEMTVAYVKERRQFARPVGSFQAIKHRLADLWVAVTQARAAARYAAACLAAGDPDAAVAVALAKATCSDVALKATQETVQLHGGIGFTWEHPAHLFLKRAKADSIGFGTADAHRASLARLADLPPAGGSS